MIENCPMRHENGNCIPAGGFCTANKNICEALLNAYRMGKAQVSQEGTTSDLISRQAAIDALQKCRKHCIDPFDSYHIDIQDAENQLSKVPTIQLVATDTNVGDKISRQAAIRWVKTECNPYGKPTIEFESGKRVMKHLEQMPPAQPETKKGKWIRNDNGTYSCSVCHSWIPEEQHHYARYCLYCGADMRGEKDE